MGPWAPEHRSGAPCRQHTLMAHATLQAVVRVMLERVWERGDIYKANYEGVPPSLRALHELALAHLLQLQAATA